MANEKEKAPADETPPVETDEQPVTTDDSPPEADIQKPVDDTGRDYSWEEEELEYNDEAVFDKLMAEDEKAPETPPAEPEAKEGEAKGEEEKGEEGAEEEAEEEEKPKTELATTVGALTGEAFESDDAAIERVREIKDENEGYRELKELLQGNEEMGAFFTAMIEKDLDPADAAAVAFKDLVRNRPDPYDDPDGYAEYMKKEGIREADARHEAEKAQQRQDRVDRAHTDIDRAFNSFVASNGLNEGEAKAFAERFSLYRVGDPETGRVPPDVFERESKAEKYDKDVKDAYERGLADGKNEAIKNVTSRRGMRGDGIPALEGSRKPVEGTSEKDREWEKETREFAQDGSFDGDW